MNKYIIVGGASAVASGVVGFFIGKLYTTKKMYKKMDKEIESVKNYYDSLLKANNNVEPQIIKKETVKEEPVQVQPDENKTVPDALNDLINEYKSQQEEKPKRKYVKRGGAKVSDNKIREIDVEAFSRSSNNCESLVLYANGVLVDGMGMPITNPHDYIGEEGYRKCMEIISMQEEPYPDTYFSNEVMGVDFEVELTSETYSQ